MNPKRLLLPPLVVVMVLLLPKAILWLEALPAATLESFRLPAICFALVAIGVQTYLLTDLLLPTEKGKKVSE